MRLRTRMWHNGPRSSGWWARAVVQGWQHAHAKPPALLHASHRRPGTRRAQGRIGTDFDDANEALLAELCAEHPDLISLEMETFHLLDLARCSRGERVRERVPPVRVLCRREGVPVCRLSRTPRRLCLGAPPAPVQRALCKAP